MFCLDDLCRILIILQSTINLQAAGTGIERRQFICLKAKNRNAFCLKHFQRLRKIKNRLCAGTDYGNIRTAELFQIRRNIKGCFSTPMNAADASCHKKPDTAQMRNDHGCRYGCRSPASAGTDHRQISAGYLRNRHSPFSEFFYFFCRHADNTDAIYNSDRSGDTAMIAYDLFHF